MDFRFTKKPIFMGFFFACFLSLPLFASKEKPSDILFYYDGVFTKLFQKDFERFFPGFTKSLGLPKGSQFKFFVFLVVASAVTKNI